jgi:hypothetical protein
VGSKPKEATMNIGSAKPLITWTTAAVLAVGIIGGIIGGAVVLGDQGHSAPKVALVQRSSDETPTTQTPAMAPTGSTGPTGTTGVPQPTGTTGTASAPTQSEAPTTQAPVQPVQPVQTVTPTTNPSSGMPLSTWTACTPAENAWLEANYSTPTDPTLGVESLVDGSEYLTALSPIGCFYGG